MNVYHLNCGDMDLLGTPPVCHVLLLETKHGLALVDSGFSTLVSPRLRVRSALIGISADSPPRRRRPQYGKSKR